MQAPAFERLPDYRGYSIWTRTAGPEGMTWWQRFAAAVPNDGSRPRISRRVGIGIDPRPYTPRLPPETLREEGVRYVHRLIDLILDEHVSVQAEGDRLWDYPAVREQLLFGDLRVLEEASRIA